MHIAQEEVGCIDQDAAIGCLRCDGEAGEHRGGEGLADGEQLICVSGTAAEGLVGLNQEDLGAGAFEAHDLALRGLSAIQAEVI